MEPVEEEGPRRPDWLLPALSVFAVVALIVVAVLFAMRDDSADDTLGSTVVPTEPAVAASAPADTAPPSTAPSSTPTSTTVTSTTVTSSTVTSSTGPPSTTAPDSSGPPSTITIESVYLGQVTLPLAATDDDVSVYDGAAGDEQAGLRCAVVVTDGLEGSSEWCGTPGEPIQFVTRGGDEVLLVELGASLGDVSVRAVGADWLLPTNGCAGSVGALLDAAVVAPSVMTSVVCVPGEAFVGIGQVLLQDGPPDGGAILLLREPDGTWTSSGGGTSFPCDDPIADGVDRCARYDVPFDLFEALLPIPPAAAEPETADIVGVRDVTEDIRGVVGSSADPTEIGSVISATYADLEGPEPTIERFDDVWAGELDLVIVVVPALDDSIRSTTYAVWVGPGRSPAVVRAYAFETCARGLAGDDLCI